MRQLNVKSDWSGKRADVFLASKYPQFARSAVSKLFDMSLVTLNDEPIKAGLKLKGGEVLLVDDHLLTTKPQSIELPIIFEDKDCVVINKPYGVLSHGKGSWSNEATVASWLRQRFKAGGAITNAKSGDNSSKEWPPNSQVNDRAGIVHRLDRTTSGVMICAKNSAAQAWLQGQFSQRKVVKTYFAWVAGKLKLNEAVIDMPITRSLHNPKIFVTSTKGKPASTTYKVLKQKNSNSLLELKPTTGRTHQLRVHLQAIGHPIIGDAQYGGPPAERLMLHAEQLSITLPNKVKHNFKVAPPAEFKV